MIELFEVLHKTWSHPFNKKKPILGLWRFIRWQVNNILNPNPIIHQLTGNSKLIVQKGMKGATGNLYNGLLEFSDMLFVLHCLRPEDHFVDIGANIGVYTVLASAEIGAATLSIEPVPEVFATLELNIAINKIGSKVRSLNMAIGAEEGKLTFTSSLDTVNHVATAEEIAAGNVIEVKVIQLDSIIENIPTIIKIDVEGYETNVIKGAEKTLENPLLKAIIIELNGSGLRYGFDETAIHHQFLQKGFQPYQYDPFERNLILLNAPHEHNTIYIRDVDFIKKRLQGAKKIKVQDQYF
jgi:FkbM family methyltransferase